MRCDFWARDSNAGGLLVQTAYGPTANTHTVAKTEPARFHGSNRTQLHIGVCLAIMLAHVVLIDRCRHMAFARRTPWGVVQQLSRHNCCGYKQPNTQHRSHFAFSSERALAFNLACQKLRIIVVTKQDAGSSAQSSVHIRVRADGSAGAAC